MHTQKKCRQLGSYYRLSYVNRREHPQKCEFSGLDQGAISKRAASLFLTSRTELWWLEVVSFSFPQNIQPHTLGQKLTGGRLDLELW